MLITRLIRCPVNEAVLQKEAERAVVTIRKREKQLAKSLPAMPKFVIRGHADASNPSFYCFIVSAQPIEGLLSAQELLPANFFPRLFHTVRSTLTRGIVNARKIERSEYACVSLYTTGQNPPYSAASHWGLSYPKEPHALYPEAKGSGTFPPWNLNLFMGQVFAQIRLPLPKVNLENAANVVSLETIAFRSALNLLLRLSRNNWLALRGVLGMLK